MKNKKDQFTGKEYALSTVTGGMGDVVKRNHFSIRTKEYRYIRYANNKEELYDHRKDKYEWNNVASKKKYQKDKNIKYYRLVVNR